jgi:hypothetical protein
MFHFGVQVGCYGRMPIIWYPLKENWDFVTNQFATSCDYLTFTTIVGYIYNYFLHLKPLATTL